MKTIDERIVDMRFNNKQFEDGIQTSLKSLNNLKNGLDDAEKGSSLGAIQTGVEKITKKFSALGIIGLTTLQNIANKLVDISTRVIKSFTIDPVMDGYQDYERKLTSVQTIMNATGESIKTVSRYFDVLDEYADLTIYDLDDMTSAFAKFTNAGVEMDKSVPAIKGIANMVALAGQDANAAAIAMYNLSQSIAGGFLTTMDYRSLNLANVATKEWKNQMIEGAVAAGTLKKNADGLYNIPGAKQAYNDQQLFTEALSDGWATTAVLLDVLGDYGDTNTEIGKKAKAAAQDIKSLSMMMDTLKASVGTSWTDTFEMVIGDLEESKELFTGLTNVIGGFLDASAKYRNELLQGWKDLGGRSVLIESIKNAFDGVVSAIIPIKDAFKEIFPPMTSEKIFAFTEGLKSFTEKLKIGKETAASLKSTFKGLFALLDIGGQFLSFLIGKITDLCGVLATGADGLLSFTGSIGEWLSGLNDAIRTGDVFNKAFDAVKNGITKVAMAVKSDIKGMMETPFFQALQSALGKASVKIKDAFDKIKKTFSGWTGIDLSGAKNFVDGAVNNFRPFTALGHILSGAFDFILKVFTKVAPIFSKLATVVGDAFGELSEAIGGAFSDGGIQGVLDLINSGLFTGILLGIKKFTDGISEITGNASGFLDGITGILDGVKGSLEAYQNTLKAKTLITIATAIAILSASLVVLSMINPEKLGVALVALTTLFIELAGTMVILSKSMGSVNLTKTAGQMVLIAGAILILSIALKNIAEIDVQGLLNALLGVGVLMGEMAVFTQIVKPEKLMSTGIGMIAIAAAINILSKSVQSLGELNPESLAKGLVGVGVIMAEISAFSQITKPEKLMATGLSMIAMGGAMTLFSKAVSSLGGLSPEELAKGLTAIGVVLVEIGAFSHLVAPDKLLATSMSMIAMGAAMTIFANVIKTLGGLSPDEIAKGLIAMAGALGVIAGASQLIPLEIGIKAVGLVILSAALLILGKAMSNMGGMSWEEIGRSLVVLAGSLAILTIAMQAMTGGLPGAAAMIVMASALSILAPALATLGAMDLKEIGIALLALIGVFAVVGLAGSLLAPLTPAILGLAVAIALLGVGVLAVGVGLLAFSTALTALAVSGTAGAAALVIIITSIIGLIPMIIKKLGEGIIAFIEIIARGMPRIIDAVKAIGLGLIAIIGDIIPPLVNAIIDLLVALLDKLAEAIPDMVDAGLRLIVGILEGFAAHIKDVIVLALKIIEDLLRGLAEGLPGIIAAAVELVSAFIIAIGKEAPKLIDAGLKMIIEFINGIANAIRENTKPLIDAVGNLADAILDGLIQGLLAGVTGVVDTVVKIGKEALGGIKKFLGIHSPSKVFEEEVGKNIALGTAKGVENNTDKATKASKKMAKEVYDNAKLWIEDYRNDTKYLMSEELEMWKILGRKYSEISKEKIEIDKNIASLQKKIADEIREQEKKIADEKREEEKKSFEFSKKWIDERKKYGDMTLMEELAAWERVQNRYAEGTELRKEADEQAFEVQNRLFEERDRLISKMEEAENRYSQSVDDRTMQIVKAFGLFDALKEKEEVSGKTLIDNLKAQVDELESWSENLQILSQRGVDEGLIQELQKMGPSANAEISALSKLTNKELTKYQDLWKQKSSVARTQAIEEFKGLRADTDAEIKGLIDDLENLFSLPSMDPDSEKNSFISAGKRSIDYVITGYKEKEPDMIETAEELSNNAVSIINDSGPSFTEAAIKNMTSFISGIKSKLPELLSTTKTLMNNTLGEIYCRAHHFVDSGKNLSAGFIDGIRSQITNAANAARDMANAAINAVNTELGINSPSKEFFDIGRYVVLGFVNAIKQYGSLGSDELQHMGSTILDEATLLFSLINALLTSDMDISPVITPVIDFTKFKKDIGDINKSFAPQRSIDVSSNISKVSGISASMQASVPHSHGSMESNSKSLSFTQNNYSPKALSRSEIYRHTKNQLSVIREALEDD